MHCCITPDVSKQSEVKLEKIEDKQPCHFGQTIMTLKHLRSAVSKYFGFLTIDGKITTKAGMCVDNDLRD